MTDDEPKITDEQLRLATSRSLPAGAPLDAETASLRDGFLALGSAVQAAAGPLNEAALIARLERPRASEAHVVARPLHRDWLSLLLAGALAASALIAITRVALVSHPADVVAEAPATPRQPQVANHFATGMWNDSLDDEIVLAALTIDQLRGNHRSFDHTLLNVNERLEALSEELARESL
jgi:hypothetical protein